MKKVTLASPWTIYVKKVEALFSGDKDVKVEFDEDTYALTLYVDGFMGRKAEAIERLMPNTVSMGNIILTINVVPGDEVSSYEDDVKAAFYGNENFVGVKSQSHGAFGDTSYALFKNKTAQFYTDDLTQYGGMGTYVIADLAKEILNPSNSLYFSTEVTE